MEFAKPSKKFLAEVAKVKMTKEKFLEEFKKGYNLSVYCKTKKQAEACIDFFIENGLDTFAGGNKITKEYAKDGLFFNYLKIPVGCKSNLYSREREYVYGIEYGTSRSIMSKYFILFENIDMNPEVKNGN